MSKGIVLWEHLMGQATLTVSSEKSGSEKEYLLMEQSPGLPWGSVDISENYVRYTFASPPSVSAFVFLHHNLVAGDTFQLEGSNDGFQTPAAESIAMDPGKGWYFPSSPWTYTSIQGKFQKTAGNNIEVGMFIPYKYRYEFEINYARMSKVKSTVLKSKTENPTGQTLIMIKNRRYERSMTWEGIGLNQRNVFEEVDGFRYICFLPDGQDGNLYYGSLEFGEFSEIMRGQGTGLYEASAFFQENPGRLK